MLTGYYPIDNNFINQIRRVVFEASFAKASDNNSSARLVATPFYPGRGRLAFAPTWSIQQAFYMFWKV